jgi:hypothetical protein
MSILLIAAIALMSAEEMKETGISRLSPQEQMALEEWIEEHYDKKLTTQNNKQGPVLQENLKSGRYIRLSDNSLWEINPADTPITQGWITPVEIKVSANNDKNYPYLLTNTLTGSSVKAKKPTTPLK